jgi:hypothetical protein
MTTTAVEAKPGFEVLKRGVLLQDVRMWEPISPVSMVYGDIARLSNGELWARPPRGFLPFRWDESHQPVGHRLACYTEPSGWFEDGAVFKLTEASAIAEIRRFRAEWPVVSGCLCLAEPPLPEGMFEAGTIRYPQPRALGPFVPWQEFLLRHLSCDWGLDRGDVPEITDEIRWLIEFQPRCVQNIVAIGSQSGTVVSRHLTTLPVDNLCRSAIVVIATDLDQHQTAMRLDRFAIT